MNEIIKITEDESGRQLVSGRELHDFLEIGSRFNDWISNRIKKYAFKEDLDYTKILVQCTRGQNEYDYALTIDMSKELSMVENNERGQQARRYFIACESKLKEVGLKANILLSIYNGGQNAILASKQLAEIEVQEATKPLLDKIEDQKADVEFSRTVAKSCDNILMRDMAKLLCENHINIGEKRLYKLLRLKDVLMGSNDPYQSYIDRKYFVVKESTYNTPYGEKLNRTTLVTPKGQIWLVSKVKEWLEE